MIDDDQHAHTSIHSLSQYNSMLSVNYHYRLSVRCSQQQQQYNKRSEAREREKKKNNREMLKAQESNNNNSRSNSSNVYMEKRE